MNYLQKKKRAFMSIVNSVKGFLQIVTGKLPLTLDDCVDEESITNYRLYGQSMQNGTPTTNTPVEVESVGEYDEITGKYKIPIKVSGKNLFNESVLSGGLGITEYNGVRCLEFKDGDTVDCFRISGCFKENTIYTVTMKVFSANTNTFNIRVYYTDGTYETIHTIQTKINETFSFSTKYSSRTVDYIRAYSSWNTTRYLDLTTLQLEEGATATDYEPYHEIITNIYLDEPLRKVGDYADYVDFRRGKVIRNVYSEFIDTVDMKSSNKPSVYTIFLSRITKKPFVTMATGTWDTTGFCISNKFKRHEYYFNQLSLVANSIQTYITTGGSYRVAYTFDDKTITSIEQAQEKIGDGFEIFYVLDEPIEQSITLPTIPTFKGTSVISADTTVQPSDAKITYYSSLKE